MRRERNGLDELRSVLAETQYLRDEICREWDDALKTLKQAIHSGGHKPAMPDTPLDRFESFETFWTAFNQCICPIVERTQYPASGRDLARWGEQVKETYLPGIQALMAEIDAHPKLFRESEKPIAARICKGLEGAEANAEKLSETLLQAASRARTDARGLA